ncbi:MAG: HlyD family secretion protein [Hyphomonadaceae bacterium]|nr:HlyD family secretion protein [Hyphomonadaceae bacterium]
MALKTVKLEAGVPHPETAPEAAAPAAAAPPAKPDLRKKIIPIVGGVAALAVLWMGGNWLVNGRFEIKTDNAYVRSDITRVTPKVQGYVTAIHVNDNQPVKAGDLLITLEASDFQARVASARADLAQAEADAAQANARIAAQRDQLAEARAAREAADASADWSSSDAKRLAELAEKGWYPKARVEQAQAAERTANAQRTQAEASVTAQRSQLTSTEAAAQSAQAKIDAAKAKLDAAELDLGRTEIRAPIDGVVANKVVTEGQLLSPNQVAMAIVPEKDSYIIANFKETQIAEMKPGQRVSIHVDAYPSLKVKGTIESLAPNTGATFSLVPQDTATGNFTKIVQRVPVRIGIDDESLASGLLRSGLAVVVTVSTKDAKE